MSDNNALISIEDPTTVSVTAETAAIASDALSTQIEALEADGILVTQRHPWRNALREIKSRLEEVYPQ